MTYSLTGTSSSHKNRMEGEVVSSNSTSSVCISYNQNINIDGTYLKKKKKSSHSQIWGVWELESD